MKIETFGWSDKGKVKSNNEDHFAIIPPEFPEQPYIIGVSDGVGGRRGGEMASVKALQVIGSYLIPRLTSPSHAKDELLRSYELANSELRRAGEKDEELAGMGTTAVVGAIFPKQIFVCSVGDSRAYAVNGLGLKQVTDDHTLPNELYKRGSINEKQFHEHPYRHHLTRALGIDETVKPDVFTIDAGGVNWFLLCTDGLTEHVNPSEIMTTINKFQEPQLIVKKLIAQALLKGGTDNVTVVLAKLIRED